MTKLAIRCNTKEEFLKVQKKFFTQGYHWYSGSTCVLPLGEERTLYIIPNDDYKSISYNTVDDMGESRYKKVIDAKDFLDIQLEFEF